MNKLCPACGDEYQHHIEKCADCGTVVFYPRAHCTGCVGGNLVWKTASGKGTIYTFSIVRKAEHPYFRTLVPYAVAWIDLDEGPRILSNVVGTKDPAKELSVGQRVTVECHARESGHPVCSDLEPKRDVGGYWIVRLSRR